MLVSRAPRNVLLKAIFCRRESLEFRGGVALNIFMRHLPQLFLL